MQIDSEKRVIYDLEIVCWDTTHVNFAIMVAIPSIVIWGLGIPLISWILLARESFQHLDTIECRQKYGFLYNGYKKKFYYWESVNMYRKITIIFISAFLKDFGVITQALVVFLVLIFFLYLNIKAKPFAFGVLNDMEALSILTSMLTIYCGLYYLSDMPEVYNSTDSTVSSADNGLRLTYSSKIFLFLVILLSNILFFAFWAWKMLEEFKNTLMEKFQNIYLYIFCCGNKERLNSQLEKKKKRDQHDILLEELENRKLLHNYIFRTKCYSKRVFWRYSDAEPSSCPEECEVPRSGQVHFKRQG